MSIFLRPGQLGPVTVRLSLGLTPDQRYQRRYVPVDPENTTRNLEEGLPSSRQIARWKIDGWDGGEGESRWRDTLDAYNESTNVRPLRRTEGIDVGAYNSQTKDSGGVSNFTQAGWGLTLAQGNVWTALSDGFGYQWDQTLERWQAGIAIGSASEVVSMADGYDTFLYSGHADDTIRRFKSGSNQQWFAGFVSEPILQSFSGQLFALDGDDLYEIDRTVQNTRTLKADVLGDSSVYLADVWARNRLTTSERGPIWLQRLNTGETILWEFNVFADAQFRLGKLPLDFVYPYSIMYANGFVFVGFRLSATHNGAGDAYVYYQRGAQKGVLGPLRAPSGVTAAKPVLLGGLVGEEVVILFDGAVWGYTPSTGGLAQICTVPSVATGRRIVALGSHLLAADSDGSADFIDLNGYTTGGTLDSGRFDFRYPGLTKLLVDVTVETDPLPAGSSVECWVSADRQAFVQLAGVFNTAGGTTYRWQASNASTAVTGREFELRLELTAASRTASPIVRGVTGRATGGAHEIEWVLGIDCNTSKVEAQDSDSVIDALNALTSTAVVTFTDPWQNRQSDSADAFDVTVEDLITPHGEEDAPAVAIIKLRALNPVVSS